MYKIICPRCSREVEVINYGNGWVGGCCNEIVYNSPEPPAPVTTTKDKTIPQETVSAITDVFCQQDAS